MLYFDCFSGASGDMLLGALVDLGLSPDALSADLAKLDCGRIGLRSESVTRCGLRATKVHVEVSEEPQPHRPLGTIRALIENSSLPERVKDRAVRVFSRLAEAEASVHGTPIEKVHFHEVGALDAIADIVGFACGMERLGIDRIMFSTLRLGGGTVEAAHGTLPVPAPATAQLVAGFRCEMGPVDFELLTPTGAAILTTLGEQQHPPSLELEKVGYGAGGRDIEGTSNVVRAILGRVTSGTGESDSVWVIEATLDDTTPEACGYAMERLMDAGALDAYATPIQMKKSRPAIMLCAVVKDEARAVVEDVFFRETTTFGVRRYRVDRVKLARESVAVETPYGPVGVKVGRRKGEIVTVSPEYEDCRRVAVAKNVPLREVMALALDAFKRS